MDKKRQSPAESTEPAAEPVKLLPGNSMFGSGFRDLKVADPPKPVDGPVDPYPDPGKPRSAYPPEIQAIVGVPRAVVRGFTNPTTKPKD